MTWKCTECGYEYSACLGDDEVPSICECGSKINHQENAKSGYEFKLVDEGTLDTVIAVSGSDVRYTYSQEYRNSFDTFDEFWTWVVNDIEQDIAENGLEEDLEDM